MEIQTVTSWHEALNSGNMERLVELSHPEVEVGGPRGTGHGAQLLREWVDRANLRLEPARIFHEVGTVVVEQKAGWRSRGQQTVASVFVVRDDLMMSALHYPPGGGTE
jgi:SnoaL-like domain